MLPILVLFALAFVFSSTLLFFSSQQRFTTRLEADARGTPTIAGSSVDRAA